MRRLFVIFTLALPILVSVTGCERDEGEKEIHYGPDPGDGVVEEKNAKGIHYGPGPNDGANSHEASEGINFGPNPGDG